LNRYLQVIIKAGNFNTASRVCGRQTMAVELRKRGVPPWEVQGILGHKSGGYRTTEICAKYDPDYLSKSAQAIDDYMNEVLKRVKRPLDTTRLKRLRLSCVLERKKIMSRKNKNPRFPEGF